MRLLERQSQIEALDEYAREARQGQGRLVLVSGEAGVGKSSLLERMESSLPEAQWFWGACDGLFTPRPLGPLLDIAASLGGELDALCRTGAPREALFAELLQQMRAPGPLRVFAVEDVHWADEATLDLLRFLGRRMRDARSLLLVTFRDDGLAPDDPLRMVLGELATQRSTRRVSLPRLSAEAVAMLADGSGLEPSQLFALTGGNPFFVTELLQHGKGELPTSARDAVLAHVAGLRDDARRVLDVAALIGSRVEPALLVAVTDAAPEIIDELLSSGVLTSDGDRLRFRHEIARLAVEQAIGVHRRGPIHEGILDGLCAAGCDDDARVAFHAEGAGNASLVLQHAPRAAQHASSVAAHREATAQYERALRFADDADVRTRAELYDALAFETSLVDRWPASADAAQAALALWRSIDEPIWVGASLGKYARAMWRLCRGDEANAAVQEALAVLEPLGPTKELAWAYAQLATRRMQESHPAEAIERSHQAQNLAEMLGLPEVLSDALNTEGCAISELGGNWRDPLQRALDIAVTHGIAEQAGRAFANLHAMLCSEQRFAEAERMFVDGIAYCDEHDISTFSTCLRGEHSATLEKLGRWDEAEVLARQMLERAPSPVNRINPQVALGKVRARRGDATGWEPLDEAAEATDSLGEPGWILMVRLARAEASWLEGDLDSAARELERSAAAAAICGSFTMAEVEVWRARITGASPSGSARPQPYATQLAGNHEQAARLWDDIGCPYEAALALLDSTDETLLRDALRRFEQLGAVATARLARQRMRELGVKSVPTGARATTRANHAGLTRREREVLELVCEGHTNDEISGRLFISVKTVDHHVSAVLSKLGVPSRRVAASEALRRGLVHART